MPVESGLLEGIVLSVALLRSGRSFGDSQDQIDLSDPRYFGGMTTYINHVF